MGEKQKSELDIQKLIEENNELKREKNNSKKQSEN